MHAATPFEASATADIILRSSDSVDFFVIKLLLCLASPTFGDIFSNHTIDSEDETQNGLPIVSVTEHSRTLRFVLLSIYPPYATSCEPVLDIDDIFPVAKAIRKYSMPDCFEGRIKEMVVATQLLQEHGLRVYALAVHLGWTDIAAKAALNTLATPLSDLPFVDELHMISGADFYQYLSYRFRYENHRCGGEKPQLTFVSPGPEANGPHSAMAVANVPAVFGPNAKVDAVLRSSDGIDFYVKKSFLSHLSPVFEELFANSDSAALNNQRSDSLVLTEEADDKRSDSPVFRLFTEEEDSGAALNNQRSDPPVFTIKENNDTASNNQRSNPPVFTVEEDSDTLSGLLCLLHPYVGEPCISNLKLFPKIWTAAQRYQVTFIFQRLEQSFLALPSIRKEPLRSFAIGVSLGWTKVINACAMETLIKPLSEMEYADEVRIITGADLYRLVEYRFKCANSIGLFLDDMAKSDPAAAVKTFTMYFKSRLLDCPRGITMTDDDSNLVQAAKAHSVRSTYYTSVLHLLQKRRILLVTIDNIISKVCLSTLFC